MKTLPKWFNIQAGPKRGEPVEILIHGSIGEDVWSDATVTEGDISDALKEIPKGTPITVGINTPGGSVSDGLAIYNALRRRSPDVTTRNDGYAVSTGSLLMLAGDHVVSPKSSVWMIHDPWTVTQGSSADHLKAAEMLNKHAEVFVDAYARKTGKGADVIRDAMRAETWFKGDEAVAYGLADSTGESDIKALTSINVSGFTNVPDFVKAEQRGQPKPPAVKGGAQTRQVMNRNEIIALLNKHGVEVADDISNDLLQAKLEQVLAKKQEPVIVKDDSEIKALKAQVESERTARITARYDAVSATRPGLNREEWLPKALKDESIIDLLKKMPEAGSDPVRQSAVNKGNSIIETYAKMKPGKERNDFRVENHDAIVSARREFGIVKGANTIDSALTTDYLSDGLILTISSKLAMLKAFTTEFSMDPVKPKATVQVAIATTGSAVQTDATNFESGDTTLDNVAVSMSQITKSFHVTNAQVHSGIRLAQLAGENAILFGYGISDVITALMIAANYGAATTIGTAANFDSADMRPILALAKNYNKKVLLLDGGHLAYLLPTDRTSFALGEGGAYGFDLIVEQNRWTGGVANIAGFVTSPTALVVASGLPINGNGAMNLAQSSVTIPGVGLTVQTNSWFSLASRTQWASYDVMFGAAVGDSTAAENLVTA